MVGKQDDFGRVGEGHVKPRRSRAQKLAWWVIGGSLLLLLLAVTFPLWIGPVARRLIPDRYLVTYAPEPIKEWIYNDNAPEMLPTPIPGQGSSTDLLSNPIAVSPTPAPTLAQEQVTSTSLPTIDASGPTPTLTPAFVEENAPTATATPIPQAHSLGREFTYTHQGWNMCGPATLAMYLSYYGIEVKQTDVSNAIKPHPEDSNTSPHELAEYAESLGFVGLTRINGNVNLIKSFIAAGYPVMIERGFDELPDDGWMGHYMLLIGFDDAENHFEALDSYWGRNRVHEDQSFPAEYWDYENLDRLWRHFNRVYIVVYPPEDAEIIAAIIGEDMDDSTMLIHALQRTQEELRENPDDPFGWFNLGSILVELGDFDSASGAYDEARRTGKMPWRMLWYQFGIYEAYYQTGRYEDVLTLANTLLQTYPESEEAFTYRGLVYEAREEYPRARREFNKALQYNPNYIPAQEGLQRIEDK